MPLQQSSSAVVDLTSVALIRRGRSFLSALGVTLACSLVLAGCASPPTGTVKTALSPARLVVINQTDYEWRLALTRPSGESVQDSRLQPRASLTVDLPGGDYVIEQTALAEDAAPDLSRRISVQFQSGETYRWRLVTLLSEPAAAADSP